MLKSKLRTQDELIGLRLRVFRESICRMTRAAFALSIGIGSERLASYESGRAPLRYEVFRRVAIEHFINPAWLAEERMPPRFSYLLDYDDFDSMISGRELFSTAYERWLKSWLNSQKSEAQIALRQLLKGIEILDSLPDEAKKDLPANYNEIINQKLQKMLKNREDHVATLLEDEAALGGLPPNTLHASKKTIVDKTAAAVYTSSTDMKTRWKDYQRKLKQLCAVRGTKAAIARKLKVSRTMVSKWVDPKEPSEPSADYAFQLIEWIDEHWKSKPET